MIDDTYIDTYVFGQQCPQGKVMLETVGGAMKMTRCNGGRGFMPQDFLHLEVYVDGKRCYIEVGNLPSGKRGLKIVSMGEMKVITQGANYQEIEL